MLPDSSGDAPPDTCPVCGGQDFRRLFVKKGRRFWRCRPCRLELQHPLPTQQELNDYYDASYAQGMYKTFVDANTMKVMTAQSRFDAVSSDLPTGKWLDVGCSSGQFVAHARGRGIDCEGIDVSAVAVNQGRERGLPLSVSTLDDWQPPGRYDAVTCFDVLEHVLRPAAFVDRVRVLLRPGGALVITVPNLASLSRLFMGRRWFFYIPEEHLHYFRPSTLSRLVTTRGFRVTSIGRAYKPMTFEYALTQFQEYNPLIYKILSAAGRVVPARAAQAVMPLPLGEMCLVATVAE